MKSYHLLLIISLFSNQVVAVSYESLLFLEKMGQRQTAITQAKQYLSSHPKDDDVRLALAQFYFSEKKYKEARAELLNILKVVPNYTDAMVILINCDIELFNYQEAWDIVNYGLMFHPANTDLLKKRADLDYLKAAFHPPNQLGIQPQAPIEATKLVAFQFPTKHLQEPEYLKIKKLYEQKKYKLAIGQALKYLHRHEKDVDVRLVLGQLYFVEKNYLQAQKQMLQVLRQVPKYKDAMEILINIDIELKQFNSAKAIAKKGLLYYPNDKMLMKKLKDIAYSQHPPKKAPPLRLVLSKAKPKPPLYHNTIGLYQQNYYISDVHQTWNYSTLYYAYEGKLGKIYGKVNSNQRLGFSATQEEIEALPKITKNIYLDLRAAFAREPNLFPSHLYGAEAYVSVPKFIDFSGGGTYNFIESNHQFTLYTGSLSKQVDRHLLIYRPNYYVPNRGSTSLLHLINYRFFLHEPNLYVGMIYGRGSSPDLANLTTIDFLVTQNEIFSPYFNISFFNEQLIVNTSIYYQHQFFTSLQRLREWTGGTVSLAWKF